LGAVARPGDAPVNAAGPDRARIAAKEREAIEGAFPTEYADGRRRAFIENKLYPRGFHSWPLERRNAWFAGYNVGYCARNQVISDG
jgi:hypothetical protein